MIERVVENWLTKVNELSLQIPFCQLLAGEGHQVVHLSRHGPAEEGKDVLAIAPDGVPCAFQLKGAPAGKITLKAWEGYLPQVIRLLEIPIIHPSIDRSSPRRVYFVTNGELDEEVRAEIAHRNLDWKARGLPELETIVKGQLLTRFKELHTNFWPVQLSFERTLLEFFLADGADYLQKAKLARFILELLQLDNTQLNKADCARALASAAILTTYALSPQTEKSNHVALIEGWTVYTACLVALVEKYRLEEIYWRDSLTISKYAIEQAFENLCNELRDRTDLLEGETLVDSHFYRGRVTWLVGLISAYALWKRLCDPTWKITDWFTTFVHSHQKDLWLWGEAAIPQFLAMIWFLRQISATREPDLWLAQLITGICVANSEKQSKGLADPYHGFAEIFEEQTGTADNPQRENYAGRSYALEALVLLFVRRGWRQHLRMLWPEITRLLFAEFRPQSAWQFCSWESAEGELRISVPKQPQSWAELKEQAAETNLTEIPSLLQNILNYYLFLL